MAVLDLFTREPALTTAHVQALLFTDGTAATRAELCRRTLRRLTSWGLLHRTRGQVGQAGGGSRPAVYALTTAGDRLLALHDGRPPPHRRRRPADAGSTLREHQLAIADVHVALVEAGRARGAQVRWQSEPACWWEFAGPSGRELLKPDGYMEVDLSAITRLGWLEVDRGSQSVPVTIAAKVRRYCRAAHAKAAADDPIPTVFFATANPQRRDRIRRQVARWASRERMTEVVAARLIQVVPPEDVPPLLLDSAPDRAPR